MRAVAVILTVALASGCSSTAKRDAVEIAFLQKRIAAMESAPLPYYDLSQRLLTRVSQLPDAALAECGLYRVQQSDTLGGIARKHGVRVVDLAVWNAIFDPVRVSAGHILIVTENQPNKAPEPTPGAVTPRATEGIAK